MEWRISAILLVVLLLGVGSYVLVRSNGDLARAAPPARLLSDAPWGANVRVNDDAGVAQQSEPSIAVDPSGNAYAVWEDLRNGNMDIYFSYRPAGSSWGSNVKMNDDVGTIDQWSPSIAVDASGNAYAVWADLRNGNPDIYFSYRPAGGSWSPNAKVNDNSQDTASEYYPSIAVDTGGNAYVVWTSQRKGNFDIYFSYRPAGGSWSANSRVNDDTGGAHQGSPSIAVDPSGNAYAVWADARNGYGDIYFSYRSAGGSWGTNVRVNDDIGGANKYSPSIAVDGSGNAYAVWLDYRNGGNVNNIYFSYRPAGGSWEVNVKVNDDAGDPWYRPSIAVDPSENAYAVWYDYRNGNLDIYFSYRPAGGGPILQLPFNPAEQTGVCHNSQDGLNCLSSYFDHRYPLYSAEGPSNANTVVVYWGDPIPSTAEWCRPQQITTEGKVCYTGHDAYDFLLQPGTPVLAAADGYATYAWDNCAGNIVRIDHGNGYFTEYFHLLSDGHLLRTPATVTAGTRIGSVGQPRSINCGRGYHLHFAVRHNGIVVDPYGWTGNYQDPWPLNGGAESTCLWNFRCPTRGLLTSTSGGTLSSSDGNILVSAPPGAVTDTTLLQLALTADPVAEPSAVPAWHSFALSAQDLSGNPVVDFTEPLTLEVGYSDTDITYLWEDTLSLYSWDDLTSAWLPISTVLDLVNNKATANTTHLSLFTLMGQPLNPAPAVTSVSPSSGYSHLDTEITINGADFMSTPSVRLGLNELAVTFIDSTTLTAVVPSGLVPGTYDLIVTNPDAQEGALESAFTVLEPLKVYLPLIFKNY